MYNVLQGRSSMVGSWEDYSENDHRVVNRALVTKIRVIHRESRETYSSPCIRGALIQSGVRRRRAPRGGLMRQEGLRAKTVTKWRATT